MTFQQTIDDSKFKYDLESFSPLLAHVLFFQHGTHENHLYLQILVPFLLPFQVLHLLFFLRSGLVDFGAKQCYGKNTKNLWYFETKLKKYNQSLR